jgi:hypothetical protein
MGESLQTSQGNLTLIADQVNTISQNVGNITTTLTQTQEVLSQFQDIIDTLDNRVNSIQTSLQSTVNIAVWVLTILFIWLGLTQVGLLTQGLELMRSERQVSDQELEPEFKPEIPESEDRSLDEPTPQEPGS